MTKRTGDEITELEKFEADRVDGVANPANGFPILMLKSLSDPDATVEAAASATKAAAADILTKLAELVPDLSKADGDESENIGDAQTAIAFIARLIVREAESLAAGNLGEACDIADLLCAVDALRWFISDEQFEVATEATLATIPIGKATPAEPEAAGAPAPVTEDRINEIIKAALAEATQSHEAQLAAVRDELAKVKATPIPGGPVLTRTADDATKAAQRDHNTQDAQRFRRLAGEFATDPAARAGYLELAAKAEAAARG